MNALRYCSSEIDSLVSGFAQSSAYLCERGLPLLGVARALAVWRVCCSRRRVASAVVQRWLGEGPVQSMWVIRQA